MKHMHETDNLSANVLNAYDALPFFDERTLPELIQGQIGKLNELNFSVKKALEAAEQAEKRAKAASERSAGRALFQDKKREAIEELQTAGIDLASAVQSSAQAQKISFEFQTRLADISKYLFKLGVSNIASNRMVVRELEKRLSGASAEELSELARQEVLTVIQQLKEQEDILRKQAQMMRVLKEHDGKVAHLLSHTDDLDNKLTVIENCQDARYEEQCKTVEALKRVLKEHDGKVAHLFSHTDDLDNKLTVIENCQDARYEEQCKTVEALKCVLKEHDGKVAHLFSHTDDLDNKLTVIENCQDARYEKQGNTVITLKHELATQQNAMTALQCQFEAQQALLEKIALSLSHAEQRDAALRKTLNVRTMTLGILAVALAVVFYSVLSDSLPW